MRWFDILSSSRPKFFDVCVLGSGFAGSLAATILAKSGMTVAVIDRNMHPRFSIGESSTPAADYLLHQLATTYQIPELIPLCQFGSWRQVYPHVRCGSKRGFSYVWHGSGSDYRASSNHDNELLVAASPTQQVADTQWYRPDVDQFFFELALKYGVSAFEQCEVRSVQRDTTGQKRVWQLEVVGRGQATALSAEFIIDASGPSSRFMQIHQPVDLIATLNTNTSAIYTHVVNCGSTIDWLRSKESLIGDFPYPIDEAAVHHLFLDGWLWQIGFEGDLTSIGFVSDANRTYPKQQLADQQSTDGHSADAAWLAILNQKPVLREVLKGAQTAQMPGKFLRVERVQRLCSRSAGSDWAALPFTVGFIDPLHSTGLAHSLSGVKRICEALLLEGNSQRAVRLAAYENALLGEFRFLDQLISGCYAALDDFRLFNCWTMLYFAAATSFERLHRAGEDPSFLLAADRSFSTILGLARQSLDFLKSSKIKLHPNDQAIDDYRKQVRDWIEPFNHVGLFSPKINNMYWHTAADK